MDEQMIKAQICEMGRRMYQRNMVAANDGNISVKIREGEYFCTPTGVSKGYMTPDYICRVDAAGNLLEANPGFRPSSEMKMHMRVYARRPDIGAVVHAHPPYATSFAVMGTPLDQPIISEAVVSLGTVPVPSTGRHLPMNCRKPWKSIFRIMTRCCWSITVPLPMRRI